MKACFHFSWMKFIHKCGSGGSNHKQAAEAPLYYRNNNWMIPNPPPCVVLLYEILATAFLNYIFYYYLIIFICHGIRGPVWVDTVFKIHSSMCNIFSKSNCVDSNWANDWNHLQKKFMNVLTIYYKTKLTNDAWALFYKVKSKFIWELCL